MLACDTETTGLFLMNGATTFSIGVYDGATFNNSTVDIDPITRYRVKEHPKSLRKKFDAADLIIMHNAHFDLKALCEAGVYEWDEPNTEDFWKRIFDTTVLAHLHCSTDELSLDMVTKKYLGKAYPEDDALMKCVNKCRTLVRKLKPEWCIAEARKDHPSFLPCGKNNKWGRMDFWLPAAVLKHIPQSRRPKLHDSELKTVMLKYLKADCVNTFELAEFYFHQLLERHADDLESLLCINKQVEHITWKMEAVGLYVRPAELRSAVESCEEYIDILSEKVSELSGIEHITDTLLRDLLFNKWKLKPVELTETGNPSVNAKTILSLHSDAEKGSKIHQFLGCYLSMKKYDKKLTSLLSYDRSVSSGGAVHPSFNIVGTKTTRVSTRNPNAQNITVQTNPYEEDAPDIHRWLRKSPSMRSVFGPPPGRWWLTADYSQLQLRIFAYITDEQDMIQAFHDGYDAHDFVARRIFNVPADATPTKYQRRIAKNVNFGFVFGASAKKIEHTAGIPGLWTTVTELFPNAHRFIQQTKASIAETGFVTTLGGYPLELRDQVNQWTGRVEKAAHAGVNYLVQGAEGVIVKRAMKLCDDYLISEYPEGRIALQVHDELDFEVPERIPKTHVRNLKALMEQAATEHGVYAPVEIKLITQRWDKEVRIVL